MIYIYSSKTKVFICVLEQNIQTLQTLLTSLYYRDVVALMFVNYCVLLFRLALFVFVLLFYLVSFFCYVCLVTIIFE